jgi:hypothetical protein
MLFLTMRSILVLIILITLCQCRPQKETPGSPVTTTSTLSFTNNPNGNWQVGYSENDTLAWDKFHLCTWADTSHIVALWHPGNNQSSYYPYTGQNRSLVSQYDQTQTWVARPGEIVMEGSAGGQYAMLRFVAPANGRYKIKAVFEGVHFGMSSTDVHILINAANVFDDYIEGYGGDSTFHTIQGTHPTAPYTNTVSLVAGDIVTFAVGYGANKTHYYDTTGLLLDIEMEM